VSVISRRIRIGPSTIKDIPCVMLGISSVVAGLFRPRLRLYALRAKQGNRVDVLPPFVNVVVGVVQSEKGWVLVQCF
jgi:hypothetical protein